MRILLITEAQKISPNANIALKIARELEKHNNEVDVAYVLTSNNAPYNNLITGKSFIVQNDLMKDFCLMRDNTGWLPKSIKEKIKFLLRNPRYILPLVMSFTEDARWMNSEAKKVSNYCKERNIDLVIGVTFPYKIAKLTSRIKNVQKKIIVQLDPYTYNYTLNKKQMNKRLKEEEKVFRAIDKLYTTDLIKSDLVKNARFKERMDNIVEMEFPLITDEAKDIKEQGTIINKTNGEIAFFYGGMFYPRIRDPRKIVDIFKKLPENYVLYVAGRNTNEIMQYRNELNGRIVDLGCLTIAEVEIAMRQADFLICYNNLVPNQVPSKLFECINARKPFLNICQLDDCPSIKYLVNYDFACTVHVGDKDFDEKQVIEFVNEKKGLLSSRSIIRELFKKCTVQYVAKIIMEGAYNCCDIYNV